MWAKAHGPVAAGSRFGTLTRNGYIMGKFNGQTMLAHRVAWALAHGCDPVALIDHINGVKTDNRLANLREATPAQNLMNARRARRNTSGARGVSWHAGCGKWQANLRVNGELRHIGVFNDFDEAVAARQNAARAEHGEFFRI